MNFLKEVKKIKHQVNKLIKIVSSFSIASMRLAIPDTTLEFDDVDFKIIEFDKIVLEEGLVKANLLTNNIRVEQTGYYNVEFGISAGFGGSEELSIVSFVNGNQYSNTPSEIQGRSNNKPVSLFWTSTIYLEEGSVIDMRAKNAATGTINVHIFRLHFEVSRIR